MVNMWLLPENRPLVMRVKACASDPAHKWSTAIIAKLCNISLGRTDVTVSRVNSIIRFLDFNLKAETFSTEALDHLRLELTEILEAPPVPPVTEAPPVSEPVPPVSPPAPTVTEPAPTVTEPVPAPTVPEPVPAPTVTPVPAGAWATTPEHVERLLYKSAPTVTEPAPPAVPESRVQKLYDSIPREISQMSRNKFRREYAAMAMKLEKEHGGMDERTAEIEAARCEAVIFQEAEGAPGKYSLLSARKMNILRGMVYRQVRILPSPPAWKKG